MSTRTGRPAAEGGAGSPAGAPTPGEVLPTGSSAPPTIDVQPIWPVARTPAQPERTPSEPANSDKPQQTSPPAESHDNEGDAEKKDDQDPHGEQETKPQGSDKQDKQPDQTEQEKNKIEEPKQKDPK